MTVQKGGGTNRPVTDVDVIQNMSTGITSGGGLSANGTNPNNIDIAAGTGLHVDNYSSPARVLDPIITPISWDAITDIPLTYLNTAARTGIGFDKNGDLAQEANGFDLFQLRDYISLGNALHPNLTDLTGFDEQVYSTNASNLNLVDLSRTIGTINIFGNKFEPSSASLNVKKSAGQTFALGQLWKGVKIDPNRRTNDQVNAAAWLYTWGNGTGDYNISSSTTLDIDATRYDDNTGGASFPNGVVPVGNWTIQKLMFAGGPNSYISSTNNFIFQYGRELYESKWEAYTNLIEGSERSTLADGFQLRGWLIVRSGATDLSDPNQALFVEADKFGSPTGISHKVFRHRVEVSKSTPQTVSPGGWVTLSFDVEEEDLGEMYDPVAPTQFFIKTDGFYIDNFTAIFEGALSVTYEGRILKNGVDQIAYATNSGAQVGRPFTVHDNKGFYLKKGDYVQFQVKRDGAGDLDVLTDGTSHQLIQLN